MRDILFKAKRIDNGEWVEGYLFETREHAYIAYANQFDDDLFLSPQNIFIEVDANTICRYTGLNDNHDNKIWENDVCSALLITTDECAKENFVVRYGRRADNCKIELGFNVEWTKTAYLRNDICFWTENREVEVIGNIFDNPELLEGGGEDE